MKTMAKSFNIIFNIVRICLVLITLSACVTQQYENDTNTPIVKNEASSKEIAMTRISLALRYLKMGNSEQAKFNLEKAKQFAPRLIQVHTSFAHFYETVGETDLTIASYKKALSINNEDPDVLNNYGVFLCRQNRIDDAEKQILKAISIPSYILVAQSYENLALCQFRAQQYNKAEIYFSKALQHSPNRASSLLQMAILHYIKANYLQAQKYISLYERATRKFSANALALAYKVYAKQNKLTIAKNYAGMLVNMLPNSYESKQYISNGLVHTEFDILAENYQQLINENMPVGRDKPVVVLSPKSSNVNLTKMMTVVNKNRIKTQQTNISSSNKKQFNKQITVSEKELISSNSDDKAIDRSNEQSMMTLPVHVISDGDSLFSISKKYNIFMSSIKRWNRIKTNKVLRIGDVIYLANPKKAVKH